MKKKKGKGDSKSKDHSGTYTYRSSTGRKKIKNRIKYEAFCRGIFFSSFLIFPEGKKGQKQEKGKKRVSSCRLGIVDMRSIESKEQYGKKNAVKGLEIFSEGKKKQQRKGSRQCTAQPDGQLEEIRIGRMEKFDKKGVQHVIVGGCHICKDLLDGKGNKIGNGIDLIIFQSPYVQWKKPEK